MLAIRYVTGIIHLAEFWQHELVRVANKVLDVATRLSEATNGGPRSDTIFTAF